MFLHDSPVLADHQSLLDAQLSESGRFSHAVYSEAGIDPSVFRASPVIKSVATAAAEAKAGFMQHLALGGMDNGPAGGFALQLPDLCMASQGLPREAYRDDEVEVSSMGAEHAEGLSPEPKPNGLEGGDLGFSECTQAGLDGHIADMALPQQGAGRVEYGALFNLTGLGGASGSGCSSSLELMTLLKRLPKAFLKTALQAPGHEAEGGWAGDEACSNRAECEDCHKVFGRQCELK